MIKKIIARSMLFPTIFLLFGSATGDYFSDGYPVPAMNDKLLFYFQRSYNKNTIIYELNTLPNGNINLDKPVTEHWIRYEEGGERKDLSFFQRKAFGLQCEVVDKIKESFVLHFNCYKKRNIFLVKTANKYKTFITINGELSELNKLFIKCENNALGIPLTVKFVEISGLNIKNGNPVVEKFTP